MALPHAFYHHLRLDYEHRPLDYLLLETGFERNSIRAGRFKSKASPTTIVRSRQYWNRANRVVFYAKSFIFCVYHNGWTDLN